MSFWIDIWQASLDVPGQPIEPTPVDVESTFVEVLLCGALIVTSIVILGSLVFWAA